MSHFSGLHLARWRQFASIDIDLTAQTTILTGANGCGKTSILTVLSHHFGWHINFVSTPYISKKDKKRLFTEFARFLEQPTKDFVTTVPTDVDDGSPSVGFSSYSDAESLDHDYEVELQIDQNAQEVGQVSYSDGQVCKLTSPTRTSDKAQYQLQYGGMQSVVGMYIPSHRPSSTYHPVTSMPLS